MLDEALQKLGFSPKEVQVYNAILKARRATPAQIAKATNINRPTVYSVAKSLVTKGLLAEDLGGKTLYLVPVPPEELERMMKKDEQALKEKEKLVNQMREELSRAAIGMEYPVPKIRFVEEQNVEDYLYDHALIWQKSANLVDGTWWGFQDHSLVEQYRKWIDFLWKEVHPGGHVKLLSNKSDIEKRFEGKYLGREIKFSETLNKFTATTWVVGDYVIMLSTANHPYYLVEFHDALLAHNMREVFKNLWEKA